MKRYRLRAVATSARKLIDKGLAGAGAGLVADAYPAPRLDTTEQHVSAVEVTPDQPDQRGQVPARGNHGT